MKVLIRNKVVLFIIYIFTNLVVSVILLTLKNYEIAGIVLLLFSAITGTIFFLSELYNALKIGVYFLSLLFTVMAGYGFYFLIRVFPVMNDILSAGVSAAGVVLLYSLSIIYRVQEKLVEALYRYIENNNIDDKSINFKQYKKNCVREWYLSQSNWISNQSFPMTLIRILGLIVFVSVGIFGLLGRGILIFENDIIFNNLVNLYFIVYGIILFIAGFRFSAIPAFVLWVLIFISYFIHVFILDIFQPILQHNIISYSVIVFVFALCIMPMIYYMKNELLYSNVQMYDRGEKCITVDLFISEFIPIIDLDTIMRYSVILGDNPKIPKDFVHLLKTYVKKIRKNHSLLTGYTTDSHANRVNFYVYTNKLAISELENDIRIKTQSAGFVIEDIQYQSDPEWKEYKFQLNPDNVELCSIISRSYIEQLFLKGISFDKEYEINFFINFKDKNDPVNFEKEIKYFGFNLTYSSYDEDIDCIDPEFKYYGEYKTKSFISHRRIEYLNKLLLDKSENYGALYLGEWEIDC